MDQEDQEPTDLTETETTAVTTQEENDPGEADLELGGTTGKTATDSALVL